jgi:hypothetical protein
LTEAGRGQGIAGSGCSPRRPAQGRGGR